MTKKELDQFRMAGKVEDDFVIIDGSKSVRHDVVIKLSKGKIELYSDILPLSILQEKEDVSKIQNYIDEYHIQEK